MCRLLFLKMYKRWNYNVRYTSHKKYERHLLPRYTPKTSTPLGINRPCYSTASSTGERETAAKHYSLRVKHTGSSRRADKTRLATCSAVKNEEEHLTELFQKTAVLPFSADNNKLYTSLVSTPNKYHGQKKATKNRGHATAFPCQNETKKMIFTV